MSTILYVCGAIIAIAAAITVITKGVKVVLKLAKRVTEFLDDWNGEPERDGVEKRAGVMHRLAAMESELKPNHGGSIKDAVKRIDDNLVQLQKDFDTHVTNSED